MQRTNADPSLRCAPFRMTAVVNHRCPPDHTLRPPPWYPSAWVKRVGIAGNKSLLGDRQVPFSTRGRPSSLGCQERVIHGNCVAKFGIDQAIRSASALLARRHSEHRCWIGLSAGIHHGKRSLVAHEKSDLRIALADAELRKREFWSVLPPNGSNSESGRKATADVSLRST